jgi:hypothetical protein
MIDQRRAKVNRAATRFVARGIRFAYLSGMDGSGEL